MSHSIDFEDLEGKLFVLQQIALASEIYCSQEMIGSELDLGDGKFDIYWGWIKGIVSEHLIDCAIKTRIFQDILTESEVGLGLNLSDIDTEARKNLFIGVVREGNFEITLRETCNKIIHAKKSVPSWTEKQVGNMKFKYWDGCFHLHGSKGNKAWHLELNVGNWAKAMSLYHEKLSSPEIRSEIGQDW